MCQFINSLFLFFFVALVQLFDSCFKQPTMSDIDDWVLVDSEEDVEGFHRKPPSKPAYHFLFLSPFFPLPFSIFDFLHLLCSFPFLFYFFFFWTFFGI